MIHPVIWLYGMSGSGKSTLGQHLARALDALFLDGDVVRRFMHIEPDYTRRGREDFQNKLRYEAYKWYLQQRQVVVASITPYESMREKNRDTFKKDYLEILIKCDIKELIKRDPKGLYMKAFRGEISNFTGISDPFEEGNPDKIIDTTGTPVETSLKELLDFCRKENR